MKFKGTVYRAHNPRWAFSPLSGEGAARTGGRFNRPGVLALYTSLTLETAVREAAQGFARKLDPLTLCSYDVDCADIADLKVRVETVFDRQRVVAAVVCGIQLHRQCIAHGHDKFGAQRTPSASRLRQDEVHRDGSGRCGRRLRQAAHHQVV